MSPENVEIVRRAYEGVNAHLEAPPELFDPDYEFDPTEVGVDFGVLRGLEAAEEAVRSYWETFDDFHIEIEEVIHADEEHVVTRVRDGGRVKGSDSEVWNRFFHVWTFGDSKIIRLSVHNDKNRALKAAGHQE